MHAVASFAEYNLGTLGGFLTTINTKILRPERYGIVGTICVIYWIALTVPFSAHQPIRVDCNNLTDFLVIAPVSAYHDHSFSVIR